MDLEMIIYVRYIIRSPEAYDGIITLANLDDEKFKSTEIKEILMNEYERRTLKERGPTKKDIPSMKEQYKKEKKCFQCNKIGY